MPCTYYFLSSVFVHLPYTRIEIRHNLIRDRTTFLCKDFDRLCFVKDRDFISDRGLGDIGDIDHGHIHTDSADDRCLLAMQEERAAYIAGYTR